MNSIICPISKETTNRSVVRITGFLVASLTFLYVLTGNVYIILGLAIDFFIRAFTPLKISPISFIAQKISKAFSLKVVKIGKAPKLFAARVGFVFTITITLLSLISPVSSVLVALTLISFALLESLANICVGCIVYTYLVLPFHQRSQH